MPRAPTPQRAGARSPFARRAGGSAAKTHGDALEQRLDWQHQQYRARGVYVVRQGPPSRPVRAIVGGVSRIVAIPLGDGPPDYLSVASG